MVNKNLPWFRTLLEHTLPENSDNTDNTLPTTINNINSKNRLKVKYFSFNNVNLRILIQNKRWEPCLYCAVGNCIFRCIIQCIAFRKNENVLKIMWALIMI